MSGSVVVVTYNGTDISDHVVYSESKFSVSAAAQPGRAQVRIKDMNQEMSFTTGREITLTVDGTLMWGGYVMSVDHIHAFPADNTSVPDEYQNRLFDLHCVDYNILLDRFYVRNTSDWYHNISFGGTRWDGDVITDILDNYSDLPGTFDTSTLVENINQITDWYAEQGWKLRKVFDTLSLWTAGVFYIDPAKRVRFQRLENVVHRWGFSDVPMRGPIAWSPADYQFNATYPFREVTVTEDGTMLANDALVWGGSPLGSGGNIVFARNTNDASVAAHNRWQIAETYFNGEPGMGIQDGVDLRADAIVNGPPGATGEQQLKGYSESQWQYRFRWFAHDVPFLDDGVNPPYRDHITVGSLIVIEMQSFFGAGAAQLLPCRTIDITFLTNTATGENEIAFDADFALNLDDPSLLWAYLKPKRTSILALPVTISGDDTTVYGAYSQCVPTPDPNGSQTVFHTQFGFIVTQLNVYLNGLLQRPGIDFSETNPLTGEFTMTSAPLSGESLYCTYRTLAA